MASASASSAFIGAPAATPYGSVGAYAKNGPASLRAAMAALTTNRDRYNFDIDGPVPVGCLPAVDCGDLPIARQILPVIGRRLLRLLPPLPAEDNAHVIGGDDSVPIPMIEAMGAQADGLLSCRLMPILTGAICIWVSGLACLRP